MKKVLVMLTLILSLGLASKAQNKTVIQAGVGVTNNVFTQDFAVGTTDGKNTVSVIGSTFNIVKDRKYQAGVKFERKVLVSNTISVSPSADVKVGLNKGPKALVFSPGASVNLALSKAVALNVSVSTPISENLKLFNPTLLKSGVGLSVTL